MIIAYSETRKSGTDSTCNKIMQTSFYIHEDIKESIIWKDWRISVWGLKHINLFISWILLCLGGYWIKFELFYHKLSRWVGESVPDFLVSAWLSIVCTAYILALTIALYPVDTKSGFSAPPPPPPFSLPIYRSCTTTYICSPLLGGVMGK